MRRRLILFLIIIIIISVVTTAFISAIFSINKYIDTKTDDLYKESQVITTVIVDDDVDDVLKNMGYYTSVFSEETGYRFTIINESGYVLADSEKGGEYKSMENHKDREEVKEAIETGRGESTRESTTFGTTYIYSAASFELSDHREMLIIRTSMEIDKWEIAKTQVIGSAIIASIIGIILAIVVALLYSNKLLRPVRKMEKQLELTMEQNMKAENIRREFVANVTHELKTPLTSISGFVETLQDDENIDPKTRERFLEIISVEAGRLARLIDDILIISDIESGRETAEDDDINVKKSINQVIDTLRPLTGEKKIALNFTCEYEMYLGGNEDRFKQLILNLTENAIKYSEAGGNVHLTAEKTNEYNTNGEDELVITVKDEGIGIADEDVERLFERFYRVDKSRSKKEGGTGLGLAIVKHIATLFDAEIKVESVIGEGSEFTVRFPVK